VKRAVAGAGAALALVAGLFWGCASAPAPSAEPQSQAAAQHDWQHYEPDGGWANYMPAPDSPSGGRLDTATGTTPHSGLARSTPGMTRMSPGP
jgi:hypothetical protein